MATRKCRSAICLATKIHVAIIEAVEAGEKSKSEVVKSFDIPKSSLFSILKNKNELLELYRMSKIIPTCT